ncbi:MAG: class I SAM-dependent methyltransferase [Crocinitomicaceae bacterium]|nr:class I SAM-dependent methyltransferase [Crocinitomicaceae bacterium]
MNKRAKKEWFASWFDTSYYHILYQHRDDNEASIFIGKLVRFLNISKGANALDLACGKGRHAVTLNDCGLNVVGLDLSASSIASAKKMEKPGLHFDVHDMRKCYQKNAFDYIFNLFTSFGYFEETQDNQNVINAVYQMLTKNGILVIDFMNANQVIKNLVNKEVKTLNGITFNLSREFDGKHIYKHINFQDNSIIHNYTERVQALFLEDFKELLSEKFDLLNVFGDYDLNEYHPEKSPRLIIIARSKN